jgi:cobalt-precorrin-5B (C1)-methyltransferase
LDLHSGRSQVDMGFLASCIEALLNNKGEAIAADLNVAILNANSALDVLEITANLNIDLPLEIARLAHAFATETLRKAPVAVETIVCARDGKVLARYG